MGAQTSHSLERAREILTRHGASLPLAQQLFAAGLGLAGSGSLAHALTDSSAEPKAIQDLAEAAFSALSKDARSVIGELVELRWSHPNDVGAALEELAIRSCAQSAGTSKDVVGELLEISEIVHSTAELELGLGSKRATPAARAALVSAVFGGKVSPEAEAIVRHLVADPRGRRIGAMLQRGAEIVADQHGEGLAIVTVAKPLSASQRKTISSMLVERFGRAHYIAQQIDDSLVGGARIRVGDNVIDGSISQRLNDLRNALAG